MLTYRTSQGFASVGGAGRLLSGLAAIIGVFRRLSNGFRVFVFAHRTCRVLFTGLSASGIFAYNPFAIGMCCRNTLYLFISTSTSSFLTAVFGASCCFDYTPFPIRMVLNRRCACLRISARAVSCFFTGFSAGGRLRYGPFAILMNVRRSTAASTNQKHTCQNTKRCQNTSWFFKHFTYPLLLDFIRSEAKERTRTRTH